MGTIISKAHRNPTTLERENQTSTNNRSNLEQLDAGTLIY